MKAFLYDRLSNFITILLFACLRAAKAYIFMFYSFRLYLNILPLKLCFLINKEEAVKIINQLKVF